MEVKSSILVRKYDYGETISQSKFYKPENKKDLSTTVYKMYNKENMKQEDIAFTLDISQTYVSKLLKNHSINPVSFLKTGYKI